MGLVGVPWRKRRDGEAHQQPREAGTDRVFEQQVSVAAGTG